MEKIRYFFLLGLVVLLGWGCSSDDEVAQASEPARIVAGQEVYEVPASGGSLDVRVNSNVELDVEVGVGWIRQAVEAREWSVKALRFVVDENTGDGSREGTIRITGGDAEQSVRVIQAGRTDSQRAALVALYEATGGDGWTRRDNWCSDKPLGEWYGVTVDGDAQVTSLRLGSNHLTGTIPEAIGDLTSLTYLSFYDNSIEGTLPESLNRLTRLKTFYFALNRLTGDVPECVTAMDYWPANGAAEVVQQTGYCFNFSSTRLRLPAFSQADAMTAEPLGDGLLGEQPLTVIYFWSTSYNYDAGIVATLYDGYKDSGLGVLAVNNDGLEGASLRSQIEANGMEGWHHISTAGTDWRFYSSVLLFDQAGECVYYNMYEDAIGQTLEEAVRERLGEGKPMYESVDYSRDGESKQLQRATAGRGIDLVFMGEAFADTDIESGLYEQTMTAAMEEFFSVEPYKTFRDRFNVYLVNVVSPNNVFRTGATHRLNEDDERCFEYARRVPGIRTDRLRVAVVYNTQGYLERSVASWYADGSYVAYVMENIGRATLVHEAGGHGFAHLMDEYVEPGNEELSLPDNLKASLDSWWRSGEFGANVDWRGDPAAVRWAHLLGDDRYGADGLGVFEGAYFYGHGCYRPTENSVMRECSVGMPFNAPSREQIYKTIMRLSEGEGWTYDYEAFVDYDAVNRTAATARALATEPSPAARREWRQRHRPPVFSGATWRDAARR